MAKSFVSKIGGFSNSSSKNYKKVKENNQKSSQDHYNESQQREKDIERERKINPMGCE